MVSDANWVPLALEPNLYLVGDYNLCGLEDSFLTAAFPLWAYAAVREIRGNYSYMSKSAQIGRWSSLIVFVICLFAEGKVRRYLPVGAAGLLFFFVATIGELP